MERETIRPEKGLYEDLYAEQKELGLSWDEYLRTLQDGSGLETRTDPKQVDAIAYTMATKAVEKLRDELTR